MKLRVLVKPIAVKTSKKGIEMTKKKTEEKQETWEIGTKDKPFGIKLEDIKDEKMSKKFTDFFRRAHSQMQQRTKNFEFLTRIAHMQSLYANKAQTFSEGTTQAIMRKNRSETIQRVPDGQIVTQFDANSLEQIEIEFLFKNKIINSEYEGKDMLKNLWRDFDEAYIYGFACVRTGFEKDYDDDIRVSHKLIRWNDVYPSPDCDYIEEANWYIIREYISRSDIEDIIDESGNCVDATYNADTVKYILENKPKDGQDPRSLKMADKNTGTAMHESIEIHTLYERGADEFVTYVPSCQAVLRRTKNYDPRKEIPLHFLILEPNPEFPLGCSLITWTMSQQQFADAFQTLSYQTLLLAAQPPIMGFGNLTPNKMRMEPRAYWPMGTNPNNKVEKFPVETTTLTQYASILNTASANMQKNTNMVNTTIATDANIAGYSATPQGVEQQRQDKNVAVNQLQKRMEVFFSEFANHALRSYLNAMDGEQKLTVDEHTRRLIWDYEKAHAPKDEQGMPIIKESIIDGDKITIDFSKLNADMLEFKARAGSLIQSEKEQQKNAIQQMIVPISQMLGNVSEGFKPIVQNTLQQLIQRLCEVSDVEIREQAAQNMQDQIIIDAMQATMAKVKQQEAITNQLAQQQVAMAAAMPPEQQQQAQANMQQLQAQMPQEDEMPPEAMPQDGVPQDMDMPPQAAMPPQGMPQGETMLPQDESQPMPEGAPMPL